jgi:hypothetical protein
MLIIRRFLLVILSLTRHLYREYKFVHIISRVSSRPSRLVIILRVVRVVIAMLTPLTILYISEARTL